MEFKICSCPHKDMVYENCLFVSTKDFKNLNFNLNNTKTDKLNNLFHIKNELSNLSFSDSMVFSIKKNKDIENGKIALSKVQRQACLVNNGDLVNIKKFEFPKFENLNLTHLKFNMKCLSGILEIKEDVLIKTIRQKLSKIVLCSGAIYLFDIFGTGTLSLTVENMKVTDPKSFSSDLTQKDNFYINSKKGVLTNFTQIEFEKNKNEKIELILDNSKDVKNGNLNIFGPKWKYSEMGIGGLDVEFTNIFRRAFASRTLPKDVITKLGIEHVRGLILFGPPGTGKTLIARKIGKVLNGRDPKIVNGPEILNKYIGQSEENIRKLFSDAEDDYLLNGESSDLHIIIFDEIDAICKQRGSSSGSTGVHDTVVNQLLSKMDGVDNLNNILIIGMTNRLDMIDSALLRPGRFEIHVEIGLPDKKGRTEILKIHTSKMRENGFLGNDFNYDEMADLTKNFSGAELAGLVKSATSFAYYGNLNILEQNVALNRSEDIKIDRKAFLGALKEVQPAFGVSEEEISVYIGEGIIEISEKFNQLLSS